MNPGGDDSGIIEDQTIMWFEKPGQITNRMVRQGPRNPIHHHHTGCLAILQRGLGNQILGKFELKVSGF
jgi:hypothetical protein